MMSNSDCSEHEHYLSMAASYDARLHAILPMSNLFFSEVLSFIPDDAQTLLELGSGTGFATVQVLNNHPDIKIVGIDHSPEMIYYARLKPELENVSFHKQDIRDPWPVGKYDVILTTLCFHHICENDRTDLLKRIQENLTPQGVFICGDIIRPESDVIEEIYRARWIRSMEAAGLSREEITSIVTSRKANYGEMESVDGLSEKMRDAGFSQVIIPYQYEISAIFVGINGR
jgi:tRNA (cmo5U34)-methyltransferase